MGKTETATFSTGDIVFARAFTDSFGKSHPMVDLLKVVSVRYIDNPHAPHWRVRAVGANGLTSVEANQSAFGRYADL